MPVKRFDMPTFSSAPKGIHEYFSHLCTPLDCAVHRSVCTVQLRGIQE